MSCDCRISCHSELTSTVKNEIWIHFSQQNFYMLCSLHLWKAKNSLRWFSTPGDCLRNLRNLSLFWKNLFMLRIEREKIRKIARKCRKRWTVCSNSPKEPHFGAINWLLPTRPSRRVHCLRPPALCFSLWHLCHKGCLLPPNSSPQNLHSLKTHRTERAWVRGDTRMMTENDDWKQNQRTEGSRSWALSGTWMWSKSG